MIVKDYIEEINTPNMDRPRVVGVWKFILLPIMGLWWWVQLIVFSIMGVIPFVLGLIGLFMELGEKPANRDWETPITMMLLPFVAPFIWWYRYFKFGEYNTLISD